MLANPLFAGAYDSGKYFPHDLRTAFLRVIGHPKQLFYGTDRLFLKS
jgi:hypothetical protein